MTALRQHLHRVGAIAGRDARIEMSYQFQMLLVFFSVAMSVIMFFFIGELVGQAPSLDGMEGGYFEFVLIGLIVVRYAMACLGSLSASLQRAQQDDTLEVLLATSTPLSVLMGGSMVVPLLRATIEATAFLAFGMLLASPELSIVGVLPALLILLLLLGTFAAVGMAGASVILLAKRGDPISQVIVQVGSILGGVYFPVDVLPEALQAVARAIPLYYGLRGIRTALLGEGGFPAVAPDVLALVAFNLVMLPAALWLLSRSVRMAKVVGTLGNR